MFERFHGALKWAPIILRDANLSDIVFLCSMDQSWFHHDCSMDQSWFVTAYSQQVKSWHNIHKTYKDAKSCKLWCIQFSKHSTERSDHEFDPIIRSYFRFFLHFIRIINEKQTPQVLHICHVKPTVSFPYASFKWMWNMTDIMHMKDIVYYGHVFEPWQTKWLMTSNNWAPLGRERLLCPWTAKIYIGSPRVLRLSAQWLRLLNPSISSTGTNSLFLSFKNEVIVQQLEYLRATLVKSSHFTFRGIATPPETTQIYILPKFLGMLLPLDISNWNQQPLPIF